MIQDIMLDSPANVSAHCTGDHVEMAALGRRLDDVRGELLGVEEEWLTLAG